MKSIIFNQHQVNHALNNEEGMFRVVVKPYPWQVVINADFKKGNNIPKYGHAEREIRPKFNVGQEIFVKEVWSFSDSPWNDKTIFYRASNSDFIQHTFSVSKREKKWRSPITMHEEYSRLTLKIKSVKVERLQDISEEDCYKSGVECLGGSQIADTGDYFESEYHFGELEERIRECGCDATIEHCDKCVYDFRSPYANTYDNPFEPFIEFWNSTHKKPEEKWEANPWVFAYSYEVIKNN